MKKMRDAIIIMQKQRALITCTNNFHFDWPSVSFLCSLTYQNAWFVTSFCSKLPLFCIVLTENCISLNQSQWRNFFMYIISYVKHRIRTEPGQAVSTRQSHIHSCFSSLDDTSFLHPSSSPCPVGFVSLGYFV